MRADSPHVTLVIPGRNAGSTVRACLDSASSVLGHDGLEEIIFVDDGSTDDTATIVRDYPARYVRLAGCGPGAARNAGWQQARTELVWFIDADCVPEKEALACLLPHLESPTVAGAGGSYGNMRPNSILACLIHEEIVARHLRMPTEVDFLATFNVLYRRDVLEALGGFDEHLLLAQDAEFAYRVRKTSRSLRMEVRSRVGHFHPNHLLSYLRTQARQGFWRVLLYAKHPNATSGDAYSAWADHLQPPLALLSIALLLLLLVGVSALPALGALALLAVLPIPMAWRILRHKRQARYLLFAPLAWVRSFARAIGLLMGAVSLVPSVGKRR